eukprot:TRINITY_DN3095_c0_g6_i1.p1 TRINITY_DN3095_c0_g6~~TRINITY_DN3095_c0_g6_i1.p1  ORF type:complete len:1013 (+),score=400.98 TRINITY_DN3095_c0_g6_i1:110-3148(+)
MMSAMSATPLAATPYRPSGTAAPDTTGLVDTPWAARRGGGVPGRMSVGVAGHPQASEGLRQASPAAAVGELPGVPDDLGEWGMNVDKVFAEHAEGMDMRGELGRPEAEAAILRAFEAPLQERLGELEGAASEAYRGEDRAAAGKARAELREEMYTWELLRLLLTDTLRTARNDFPQSDVAARIHHVPRHRWWTVSHRDAASLRLAHDHNLRRAALALVWAENVYASQCAAAKTVEQYIPHGYRTETAKLLEQGLGGGRCPTTSRRLVSALDFDAPMREKAHLHPADEETERMLFEVLLQHIRCGDVASARRLCEEKGHAVTSALLEEGHESLQHRPEMHAALTPEGVALPQELVERFQLRPTKATDCLTTERFSVHAALLDLARDDMAPGKAPFRAVFGALVGKSDAMAFGFPRAGFRDALWASLRGVVEYALHEVTLPLLEGHEDHSAEDARAVMECIRPQRVALGEVAAAAKAGAPAVDAGDASAASDMYLELQAILIQLLGSGPKVAVDRLTEVFRFLAGAVAPAAPRLAAHAAMQLWRCRLHIIAEPLSEHDHTVVAQCLDAVLKAYAVALCQEHRGSPLDAQAGQRADDLLLTVVPHLVSKMVYSGAATAGEFAVVLVSNREEAHADALRHKLIDRLRALGVPAESVLAHAAELTVGGPEAVVAAWLGEGAAAAAADGERLTDLVESIRLLTMLPALCPQALAQFNRACRSLCSKMASCAAQRRDALAAVVDSTADGAEYLKAANAADALASEAAACLSGLQRLFHRTHHHLGTQADTFVIGVPQGSAEHAQTVTERVEASHWETYVKVQSAAAQWAAVYCEKVEVPPEDRVDPTDAKSVFAASHRQHTLNIYNRWVANERRARAALTCAAVEMVTRSGTSSAWLVDPIAALAPTVQASAHADAMAWWGGREAEMRQLRAAIIPHVTETLLEMFALKAAHIPAADRAEEYETAADVVDALVQDDVAEDQSLCESFTDPQQAARIVGYLARINTAHDDAAAQKAAPVS